MPNRRGLDLDRGERLRYRGDLRSDAEIAVTDERVLVVGDGRTESVPYTNVSEVNNERFDWFLAIMSLALAGVGIAYLGENLLLGAGMAAFGAWSLLRTYRKRNRVRIHTHSRPKPVEVFPADVDALYDELDPALTAVRERDPHGPDDATEAPGRR